MNIQPLTSRPREISVTEAVEPAYERVKKILFKPFDLAKWFTIGFGAWLAGLGESGGGGGGYNGFNQGHAAHGSGGSRGEQLRHFYLQAHDYVLENLVWIVPVAIVVVLLGLAVWVLVLWLSSRGKFMFLHCVAVDRAEVAVPWREFAGVANSLFRFRIGLSLAVMVLILPVLGLLAVVILEMVMAGEPNVAGIIMTVGLGLGLLLLVMGVAVIKKFQGDFVVPIMFLRGGSCLAAWREFYALFGANFWQFVLYMLFQIVLGMAIGMIVVLAVLATCCIAGCVLLLPFLGTVLLLPVLVFKRAYALYYLAQFGEKYDVFPASPMTPPMVG